MIKNNNYLLEFIPEVLVETFKNKKISYKGVNLNTDYLIDILFNLTIEYDRYKTKNSFPLNALILKEKYGNKYNYYINYLLDNKYLYLKKNYFKGKNCKTYTISQKLLNSNIKIYFNENKALFKKSTNSINFFDLENCNSYKENGIDNDIKIKLVKDLYKIDIDYDKAMSYIKNYTDINVLNSNIYTIESIKNKFIFYKFDSFGRLHTNFTILKSYIRKNYLTIDDEKLCELDINNSQPLLLNKILLNNLDVIDGDEYLLYNRLTYSGEFYQYLIDNCDNITNKKYAKLLICKVFFGRNNITQYENYSFKRLFPTIFKFIVDYKHYYNNYKILSYNLQRMESNLIFNKIVRRIMNLNKDIEVFTIHDSITFKNRYKEEVSKIFYDEIKKEFNYIYEPKIFNI